MSQPNILFAIADDASHFSAYGHAFLDTPNADRIAAEGVRYTHAYTTNPKCAPSRASILTGMATWQLEEACNHYSIFPNKFQVFPSLLAEAGYHVGHTGKGWAPGDWSVGGFTHNPAGPEYNNRKLEKPEGTCVSTNDYARNFQDFLAMRPDDAPFCFWYGGYEPHRPYAMGEGARARRSVDDIVVPPYLPDTPEVRSDLLDYAFEIEWFDAQLGKMLDHLESIGQLDNTLVIVTSDNGMPFPRVKGQMYEQDFNLPLVARWPGQIDPGQVRDELVSFTEIAPTFLRAAGVATHEQMISPGLQDTFVAGEKSEGREFVCMGRECHDLGREGDRGYPVRCIRTAEYLYVRNFSPDRWPAGNPETDYTNCDSSPTKTVILEQHERGEEFYYSLAFGKRPLEELYIMPEDAVCMTNLADDPAYADAKASLWARLQTVLHEQNDPRIEGRGDVFDRYPYVGGSNHSWAHYEAGTFIHAYH